MSVSTTKNFGKTLELSGPPGHESAHFAAANQILKFQKYSFFGILEQIWRLFFFKVNFGIQSLGNDWKWFFGASLGPKDDPYVILDEFRQSKNLRFWTLFWQNRPVNPKVSWAE